MPLVCRKWTETEPLYHSRTTLHRFHQKLKTLKHDIRSLNRTSFGDLPIQTKQAFEDLCICQNQILANPCTTTFQAEADAARKWNHLARQEEQLYRQKSRIQWLELGDQNTHFYHNACRERAAKNNINILYTEEGEVLTNLSDIKREAISYFQRFMQSQPDNECNSRRHLGPWVTTEAITRQIDKAIRNRISSLKYTGQHKLEGLFRRWVEVYIRQ
ncbi:hypothetical protein HID58_046560 [Brassica napus]|uniref:Uncharacterized protein n=1 Tax=Brassica napus TaxID=3708 RepID=A0ABQ8AXJ1_BRANA|nr:hypothetical protein HID58_046560 [Brassica napus]